MLLFTSCQSSSTETVDNNGWVVLVGIGEYKHIDHNVSYASNDADCLQNELASIFGAEKILSLKDCEATKDNIKDTLLNWLPPRESIEDLVLIYFGTHGNCTHLKTYDSFENSNSQDIEASELVSWLGLLDSSHILVILDVCESGCLANRIKSQKTSIIAGSTDREKCWQLDEYNHGVFSYYFLAALKSPTEVDTDNNQFVTAKEIYEFISQNMADEYANYPPPSSQVPSFYSDQEFNVFSIQDLIKH